MGDLATLAKAKLELEQLYLGIPDDSVNLTFQDLATLKQQVPSSSPPTPPAAPVGERIVINKPSSTPPDQPISGSHPLKLDEDAGVAIMSKLPSLDFSKGLAESIPLHHHHLRPNHDLRHNDDDCLTEHAPTPAETYRRGSGSQRHIPDGNVVEIGGAYRSHLNSPSEMRWGGHNANYHDLSSTISVSMSMNMMSTASGYRHHHNHEGRVGACRPGIPHSNICTLCTTYVYIFRHRCLVCGRAYCRSCVGMGMGDMIEGRKCLGCLGRRFSARYIQRAGKVGCCAGYPSGAKQAELKWAERGPRRTGERGYGRGGSRSPAPTSTPLRAPPSNNPASFVMSSSYSPYSPANPNSLPF